MHQKWQRIHCDRCLEEQLAQELSEVAPRRRHVCTHGPVGTDYPEADDRGLRHRTVERDSRRALTGGGLR